MIKSNFNNVNCTHPASTLPNQHLHGEGSSMVQLGLPPPLGWVVCYSVLRLYLHLVRVS